MKSFLNVKVNLICVLYVVIYFSRGHTTLKLFSAVKKEIKNYDLLCFKSG